MFLLTDSMYGPLLKVPILYPNMHTAKMRSVCTLVATDLQPHSRDIFINENILPLDKLVNQLEGTLDYKVMKGS